MTEGIDELSDPGTTPERLAELTAEHPELGTMIANHPNAYPALREWIAQYAAIAAERIQPAAEQPPIAAPLAAQPAAPAPSEPVPSEPVLSQPVPSQPVPSQPWLHEPQTWGLPAVPPQEPELNWVAEPAPARLRGPRRRRGLLLGIAGAAVVALVAAGGGSWWYLSSRIGGAGSAVDAVQRLMNGATSLDPIALVGALAPSEVAEFADTNDATSASGATTSTTGGSGSGLDLSKDLAELKSDVQIAETGMGYTSTVIAPDVDRVTWTAGRITITGSPAKLADFVIDIEQAELQQRSSSSATAQAEQRLLSEERAELTQNIQLPFTLTPAMAKGVDSLVSVRENGGWYVSPMLSVADTIVHIIQNLDGGSKQPVKLGTSVVAAAKFGTPEAAATGLVNALAGGNINAVAAALPLPERRLLSIYGPPFGSDLRDATEHVTVSAADFSSELSGQHALIAVTDLGATETQFFTEVHQMLSDTFDLRGECLTWKGQDLEDDGYYDANDNWVDDWKVVNDDGSGCLSDIPGLKNVPASAARLVAVQENGGWLVSPVSTAMRFEHQIDLAMVAASLS